MSLPNMHASIPPPYWPSFRSSEISEYCIPIAPPRVDSSKGPPRKIGKILAFFGFFRPTQKIARDGPKWGREVLFPTNPDLADILGRTDFDFENFYFFDFFGSQLGPTVVPAWARLGPGLGPRLGPGLGPRRRRRRTNSQIPT